MEGPLGEDRGPLRPLGERLELAAGPGEGRVGPQTSDRLQVGARALEIVAQRAPDVGRGGRTESLRHHADHRVRLAPEIHRAADHVRLAEVALRELVAHDHHRGTALRLVVARKLPAALRQDPERREIARRHPQAVHVLRRLFRRQVDARAEARGSQVLEARGVFPHIRERAPGIAGVAVAAVRGLQDDRGQALRVRIRQGTQ